ncbi:MAG: multicopper oxidase domain-containing protein [Actinomycetota bacterium]|nr:multicopper oxidase domain-containing protein [Actinomycetota bacterium]
MSVDATVAPEGAGNGGASPGGVDIGAILVAIVAMLALVFGVVALFMARDDGDGTATVSGSAVTEVELTEFAFSPDPIAVPQGGIVSVANGGSQVHNFAIEQQPEVRTADLQTGDQQNLDVSALAEGTYTVICTIAGHREAGMETTINVGATSIAAEAGHDPAMMTAEEAEELDRLMTETMLAFPAETEGVGNQMLEPVIEEDGTKRFELTASIVPWEVEPGKIVDAWAYNGMVPGPWIKVDVGDNVKVHIQNDLPMGTDIHWHGIRTPNEMDGVAPLTQDLIRSGEDFMYEFTAEREAVGMYHAHHHGQMQVPNGLFAVFQIGDVPLPAGQTISGITVPEDIEIAQEIPMVLNDAGAIGLSLNGKGFPATAPIVANEGDWLLVHYFNEGLQSHPMHQHQFPQLIVAKDGIPLDQPYYADTINIAPGERYSVLINTDDAGTWVWHCHILTHVEREDGMFGMVTAIVVQ